MWNKYSKFKELKNNWGFVDVFSQVVNNLNFHKLIKGSLVSLVDDLKLLKDVYVLSLYC